MSTDPPAPSERRHAPRQATAVMAQLYLLFPEETFRPRAHLVKVRNVSRTGLRVEGKTITREEWDLLAQGVRYARLTTRIGDEPFAVHLRIAWMRPRPGGGEGDADIGLVLDDEAGGRPGEAERLLALVRSGDSRS